MARGMAKKVNTDSMASDLVYTFLVRPCQFQYFNKVYSQNSMAQTSLGLWKFNLEKVV